MHGQDPQLYVSLVVTRSMVELQVSNGSRVDSLSALRLLQGIADASRVTLPNSPESRRDYYAERDRRISANSATSEETNLYVEPVKYPTRLRGFLESIVNIQKLSVEWTLSPHFGKDFRIVKDLLLVNFLVTYGGFWVCHTIGGRLLTNLASP